MSGEVYYIDGHEIPVPDEDSGMDAWLHFFVEMFEAGAEPHELNEFYCWACSALGREPAEVGQ